MDELQVFFFPFMSYGHMIPLLDIAKLFTSRGVKSTIITTPLNAPFFKKFILETNPKNNVDIIIIEFPTVKAGLPEGCENSDQIPSPNLIPTFIMATTMLKDQIENLLEKHKPSCLVADTFFPWATDIAAKFDIPRLVFHGTSSMASCVDESLRLYMPQKKVLNDNEPFAFPNLPHEIKLTKLQIPPGDRHMTEAKPETGFGKLIKDVRESELKSYGVIMNSFYELEPEYVDHYRVVFRRKTWNIGPAFLYKRDIEEKAKRGKEVNVDEHKCLVWLNSKELNSVIYLCFGSLAKLSTTQLYEIAMGLEESGQSFIWVVRKVENNEAANEEWLPEGFEERTRGRGMIIRGWAPQVLILEHEAVGGFVTHCGWNSVLEGVTAGLPMVTWPFFGDQFYNEKLVTIVLKIGVGFEARELGVDGVSVRREEIAKAMKRVMEGEEAEEMRSRAKGFGDLAKKAMVKGGSSDSDLDALIQELRTYHA